MVLNSAISALGHLGNLNAIPTIVSYQDHPDQDVRFAVASALGCFPNHPQAVRGLTKLTMDSCSDVSDWAVFGLGVQGECDSPEIRDTLLRCLNDRDEDVRDEAAVGFGKRHNQRLIPQLRDGIANGIFRANRDRSLETSLVSCPSHNVREPGPSDNHETESRIACTHRRTANRVDQCNGCGRRPGSSRIAWTAIWPPTIRCLNGKPPTSSVCT